MPLLEVDYDFLQPFKDNWKQLLDEYNACKDKLKFYTPPKDEVRDRWILASVLDLRGKQKNLTYAPILESLIDNLPENVTPTSVSYSVVKSGMCAEMFHAEPYPTQYGFRRYHIVLQSSPNAKFEIQGEGVYKWEDSKIYEFINPGTLHRILYDGLSGEQDRVIIMFDVFLGEPPSDQLKQYVYQIATSFIIMDD